MLVPFLRPRPHPLLPDERPESADRVERRAMEIWPRLDHRALHRCNGDPTRIAAQIARRTKMTRKAIRTLIADPSPREARGPRPEAAAAVVVRSRPTQGNPEPPRL